MTTAILPRQRALVIGALVADAAAMGLHWIYDQDHIRKIAPANPEFRAPDPANYAGIPGYFAHPTRTVGDLSQYGEQSMVMLRCLLANDRKYDPQAYQSAFLAHFGYGGAYVGYIDHATRDTLDNVRRTEDTALERARALPFEGAPSITKTMVTKAMALRTQFTGEVLRQKFEEAIRIPYDDAAVIAHGLAVLEQVLAMPPASGAHDQQLPAIAKLPPLVALLAQAEDGAFQNAVASAVKTTSDHPRSATFGQVCGAMMQAAALTGEADAIAAAGRAQATPETDALLADALGQLDTENTAVTRHFGMACDLNYGVPSVLHNVLTAPNYAEAVRRNIYAGGDTCGRAILLGALMGAMHGIGGEKGIPEDWIAKLTHRDEVLAGMNALLD